MTKTAKKPSIIMAEDDADDQLMIREALEEAGIDGSVECVENGEALLDLLLSRRAAVSGGEESSPAFVLLDLNMPKLDGRKTLRLIRSNEKLRKIPVIIFTTSSTEEDIALSYASGANSYIQKPSSFGLMVRIMQTLKTYWLETVSLPRYDE